MVTEEGEHGGLGGRGPRPGVRSGVIGLVAIALVSVGLAAFLVWAFLAQKGTASSLYLPPIIAFLVGWFCGLGVEFLKMRGLYGRENGGGLDYSLPPRVGVGFAFVVLLATVVKGMVAALGIDSASGLDEAWLRPQCSGEVTAEVWSFVVLRVSAIVALITLSLALVIALLRLFREY